MRSSTPTVAPPSTVKPTPWTDAPLKEPRVGNTGDSAYALRTCHGPNGPFASEAGPMPNVNSAAGGVELLENPGGLSAVEAARIERLRGFELLPGLHEVREPEEHEAEVEADDRGVRLLRRERAEPAERLRRVVLVEARHRRGHTGVQILRVEVHGLVVGSLRREAVARLLERLAEVQPVLHAARVGAALELGDAFLHAEIGHVLGEVGREEARPPGR